MIPTQNDLFTTIECRTITEKAREFRDAMMEANPFATRRHQRAWLREAFRRGVIAEDARQAALYRKISDERGEDDREWIAEQFILRGLPNHAERMRTTKAPTRLWAAELAADILQHNSGETDLSCKLSFDMFEIYARAISIIARVLPELPENNTFNINI